MADRETIIGLLGSDWGETRLSLAEDVLVGGGPLRRLTFRNQDGEPIPALYLPSQAGAAVLYCHAHGGRYDIGMAELTDGRPALQSAYLTTFVERGWGVLCLEMPCFGARSDMAEGATAKARLWHGRTLYGQMLGEQRAALDWLAGQPAVEPGRIAVMGISMGGTLAWWLAALGERFGATVSLCCFADLGRLIATSAHDRHGHYMTVPGLLRHTTTGQLCGLAAPTPLFHGVGFNDWSTPLDAFALAKAELQRAYAAAGAADALHFHEAVEPGHEETVAMRAAALTFLDRHIGEPSTGLS
jgi:dienelactone hydrolase